MSSSFCMNSWTILEVEEFPNRNQITLGGKPISMDKSTKSESKETMVKPLVLAHFQIFLSDLPSKPTSRTCLEFGK